MEYGLGINGSAYGTGKYSIVDFGDIPENTAAIVYKNSHSDITDFQPVYVPLGKRDMSVKETRPVITDTSTYIGFSLNDVTIEPKPTGSPFYLVRNPSDLEFFQKFCTSPEEVIHWFHQYSSSTDPDDSNGYIRFLGCICGNHNRAVLYVGNSAPVSVISTQYEINWYNTIDQNVYSYNSGSWEVITITDPYGTSQVDQIFEDWRGLKVANPYNCGTLYLPLLSIINTGTGNLWIDDVSNSVDGYAYIDYGKTDTSDSSLNSDNLCLTLGSAYHLVNGLHGSYVRNGSVDTSLNVTLPYFTCGMEYNNTISSSCAIYDSIWNQVPGNGAYTGVRWGDVNSFAINSSYWVLEMLTAIYVYSHVINTSINEYDFRRGLSKVMMFNGYNAYTAASSTFNGTGYCPIYQNLIETLEEDEFLTYYNSLTQAEKDQIEYCSFYYDIVLASEGTKTVWEFGLWDDEIWDDSDNYAYDNFNYHYNALVHRASYSTQEDIDRYFIVISNPAAALNEIVTENTYELSGNAFLVLGR
jgi:hypothetical protein